MQAVITSQLVSALKPGERPYEVRDGRVKGFLLRVQPASGRHPGGSMAYYCEYGRGRRIAIGSTSHWKPGEAREEAKRILREWDQGIDPRAAKRARVADSLAIYLDEHYGPWLVAHTKGGAGELERIRSRFPGLLSKKLADITPWLIEKDRTARLTAGRAPTTVNRDLAPLRAALNKAVEWGLLPSNPLAPVKPVKVDNNARVRFLSAEEEKALRAALEVRENTMRARRARYNAWRRERGRSPAAELGMFADYLKPMVLVTLNTGVRRGELFSLRWEDIDIARAVLTVTARAAKSSRTRHIPLNDEACSTLRDWQAQQNDRAGLVFTSRDGARFDNIKKAWMALVASAEIEGFRWHDLRHTFASKLVMRGVDLNTVRELLGHSDIKMTLRYAHLAPEHKAEAVARLCALAD